MSTTLTTTNWATFLSRDPATITKDEWIAAQSDARDWPTCACGDLCRSLPRDFRGAPVDGELLDLGCEFASHIVCRTLESARDTFAAIEARTTYLLQLQSRQEVPLTC